MVNTVIKKKLKGTVVSTAMQNTAVVAVNRYVKVPTYGKYRKIIKRYKAHDPNNKAVVGETVYIESCRPISKDKHFTLVQS